jgi:hypothetical protein
MKSETAKVRMRKSCKFEVGEEECPKIKQMES